LSQWVEVNPRGHLTKCNSVFSRKPTVWTKTNKKAKRLRTLRSRSPSDKMTAFFQAVIHYQMQKIGAADKVGVWRKKSERRQMTRWLKQYYKNKSKARRSTS
jgi:hypothetical protein